MSLERLVNVTRQNQMKVDSYYIQALQLMHRRACEGATIDEIFEALPVSRKTLERQFIEHLGRTPGQELVRVRVEQAAALLATTQLPIKRIARMIGFAKTSNFSDFFRKQTGISPTGFRRSDSSDNPITPRWRVLNSQKRPQTREMGRNVATAVLN
jgi:transcriptional regulator GlxA family with amidase domain